MAEATFSSTRRLVRALRLMHGLTQEALAEKAGLDYKYFQRLELGEADNPTISTLEQLARALAVKAWVLICDEHDLVITRTGLPLSALTEEKKRKIGRPKIETRDAEPVRATLLKKRVIRSRKISG